MLIPRLIFLISMVLMSLNLMADDQDHVLELRRSGEVMALEQILAISRQHQQGSLLEVELEREKGALIYELKILDDVGQIWEMKIDAVGGKLLRKERD